MTQAYLRVVEGEHYKLGTTALQKPHTPPANLQAHTWLYACVHYVICCGEVKSVVQQNLDRDWIVTPRERSGKLQFEIQTRNLRPSFNTLSLFASQRAINHRASVCFQNIN